MLNNKNISLIRKHLKQSKQKSFGAKELSKELRLSYQQTYNTLLMMFYKGEIKQNISKQGKKRIVKWVKK